MKELLVYKKAIEKFAIVSKTDINGVITYVNQNFINISGYSKEELIGNNHSLIRHPAIPKAFFRKMWNTILNKKSWTGIIKNLSKTGEEYYVKTIIEPILDNEGEIIEFLAIRVDITDFIKSQKKAQKAVKAKSMFLANMSHEIRTPLNGIIGFTNILLKNKKLDKNTQNIIKTIDNSADTLLSTVNDILDISKIEAEGVTLNAKKFNPQFSFKNVCKLFEAKANEKNIDYKYNIEVLNCIVRDEHRLKQVLSNLIGNAIKFTPKNGSVRVYISTKEINEKEVELYVEVKDSGIGISKEKQKSIFDPFSQGDDKVSKHFGGTGLGLTISSKIISKMGGMIQVKSEEGKGSKFYFSIKAEKCDDIIKDERVKKVKNLTGSILLVEDNEVNLQLMQMLLGFKGDIKIYTAKNGLEAIKEFKNRVFDIIFMDIQMPIMGGEEALKLILEYEEKNNLIHTSIIALTANVMRNDREKYLNIGFDGYLAKPLEEDKLDKILTKYLKHNKFEIEKMANDTYIDSETFLKLLKMFFENVKFDLDELEKSVKNSDFEQIYCISHKIAGGSSAVKLDDVYMLSKLIENSAREKKEINYWIQFLKLKKLIIDAENRLNYN